MQIRTIFAVAIFIGSYFPLSLILLAQDLNPSALKAGGCSLASMFVLNCAVPLRNPAWSLGSAVICALGLGATALALRVLPATVRVSVVESKHVPADLINYVIPYVVSFMGLDYEQGPKLIGFWVFLGWMFWITYKSGQIALNPALAVLGWKLYEIKFKFPSGVETHVGRMLSRTNVNPGRTYRQNGMQDVMIAKDLLEESDG